MTDALADPERLRALLDRLEQRWRGLGLESADLLLPGLSEDEIRDQFAVQDLEPPSEAIIWWGWHGGYDSSKGIGVRMAPVYFQFLDLAGALDQYRFMMSITAHVPGTPNLLPIGTGNAEELAIHLDVLPGCRSPVREFAYEALDEDANYVIADSLEELVERWVTILDLGLCRIADGHRPEPDWLGIDAAFGPDLSTAFGTRVLRPLRPEPPTTLAD